MSESPDQRLQELEVRYSFLEKHVAAQDRVMLQMAERIDVLEARLKLMAERAVQNPEGGELPDERPPHY